MYLLICTYLLTLLEYLFHRLSFHSALPWPQVDILIVNCSLFNPTPSLAAMIINHFKMRSNIISYNLSGMGCSAGVISIALAQELLQVSQGQNFYLGSLI